MGFSVTGWLVLPEAYPAALSSPTTMFACHALHGIPRPTNILAGLFATAAECLASNNQPATEKDKL